MKVKIKKADLGGIPQYSSVSTPLANVGAGMNPISVPMTNLMPQQQTAPQQNPEMQGGSGGINWNHALASFVLGNLTQGAVSRFSPNSQQNTMKAFNKEQFNPMSYLPYTSNNSTQARYGTPSAGMKQGGMVGGLGAWPAKKMEDGGFPSSSDMADSMRKWILSDDEVQPTAPAEEEQVEPTPQQSPEYNDALQFMMFNQMFPDTADAEKGPEDGDQGYMFRRGGTKKMEGGGPTGSKLDTNAALVDKINSVLASGNHAVGFNPSQYGGADAQNLMNQAYIWRAQHTGSNPNSIIQGFYGLPVSQGNSVDALRQSLSNIGYGPNAMYSTSPNAADQARQGNNNMGIQTTAANLPMQAQGGPVTDGELYEILGDEADDTRMDMLKSGGWIKSANADIKKRGTKGVCTGSKFGSSSCPAGSRRYALAKTFRAMAKHRKKKEDGGLITYEDGGTYDMAPEDIIGLIGQGYDFDV